MKRLLTIFILFPFLLQGQTSKGFLVKTLFYQDAFYHNPNIIVEKLLNKNYSVELLLALRNGDWYIPGGKGLGADLPHLMRSNGFTIGLSGRYYFTTQNVIPNSWFVSGIIRYNDTQIKNAHLQTGAYSRTVNLNRNGPEVGVSLGRQWIFLKHFAAEIYFGGGTYFQFYQEVFNSDAQNKVLSEKAIFIFRPYLGMTLGYFFRKN
jgi:hypothetical protein